MGVEGDGCSELALALALEEGGWRGVLLQGFVLPTLHDDETLEVGGGEGPLVEVEEDGGGKSM